MRRFRGFMNYRFECDTCDATFGKEVEEGDTCPECREGKIKDKSEWVSAEQQKEMYYDIKAEEYCDNGGKW